MPFNKHILIVAENASLKFGGEAALPLHYFRSLRQRNIEAYLIVHERTREELEVLFSKDTECIYFIYDTFLHLLLWRFSKLLPRRLAYFTFGTLLRLTTQIIQRRIIKRIVKDKKIDVIHQPTPVSPKEPSMIFGMGLPVIFGPMNGGMKYPAAFQYLENKITSESLKIGEILADLVNILIPGKREATILLVANQRTQEALPKGMSGKVIKLIENGVDLSIWQAKSLTQILKNSRTEMENNSLNIKRPIKFVFIGRLVDWKAVDILLFAFKQVAEQLPVELEIIGDGTERKSLELQAKELGLIQTYNQQFITQNQELNEFNNRELVHFTGWLSQEQCAKKLQSADVLVLPSLFECGGAVILEAMTMCLPVIATNWGGPADYLDDSCGILIEPESRDLFVNNLTNAMLKLAKSEKLRFTMGQAGHQKVLKHFDWEQKLDKMLDIYQEAIERYQSTK